MGHVDPTKQVRFRDKRGSNLAVACALAARVVAYRDGESLDVDERSSLANDIWSFRKYLAQHYRKDSGVRHILLSQLRRALRY